jgi:hypothetical protein
MSKYIALRNFAKQQGMVFIGAILELPDEVAKEYKRLNLIADYDPESETQLPEKVITGAPKFVRQESGKPKNTKRK